MTKKEKDIRNYFKKKETPVEKFAPIPAKETVTDPTMFFNKKQVTVEKFAPAPDKETVNEPTIIFNKKRNLVVEIISDDEDDDVKKRKDEKENEKERIEKERIERIEKERKEKERNDQIERERKEKERIEQIEKERIEKIEKERIEKDRLQKERNEKIQKDQIEDKSDQKVEGKKSGYRSFLQRKNAPSVTSVSLPTGSPTALQGQTFVFTGEMPNISREDATDFVKRHGGRVTAAPSRKTNYVVVGDNPGESKIKKVNELGIKTIGQDEFILLVENEELMEIIEEEKVEIIKKEAKKVKQEKAEKIENQVVDTPNVENNNTLNDNELLWTVKYAPKNLKEIMGNKSLIEKLTSWLKDFPGQQFKASLLSGPPGIGKTTTATLVAESLGYTVLEFNASDTRSKKSLDELLLPVINNKGIGEFFGAKKKQALIMDEVDGMSAGDRGGMQELISFIKKTKMPIICICNDRSSQKVRSLANYCLDLRFRRPDASQVRSRLMTVCFREGLSVVPNALDQLVASTMCDFRQILMILSTWKMKMSSLSYDQAKKCVEKKNIDKGLFDLTGVMFGRSTLEQKLEAYFDDYSFVPLMVQENYIHSSDLNAIHIAAESISQSDIVDRRIHGNQAWALAPLHGMLSCVIPSSTVSVHGKFEFSSFLGMNSKEQKYKRLLSEISHHSSLSLCANKTSLRLDYMMPLSLKCGQLLNDPNGLIALLDQYSFTKADFDVMPEFLLVTAYQMTGQQKAAVTRAYNKASHMLPFAEESTKKVKNVAESSPTWALDDEVVDQEAEPQEEEEEEEQVVVAAKKRTAEKTKKPTAKKAKKKENK